MVDQVEDVYVVARMGNELEIDGLYIVLFVHFLFFIFYDQGVERG